MLIDESLYFKRVALYIRVSKDEQVKAGYSLEAQKANLYEFAKQHKMDVVGFYADEGETARKKMYKRKQFQTMLESVKKNEIDIIIFIKLDRWFRNISDYYKIQEILESHNVQWIATQESYDTTTATGRLNLNIRLSIAQDEADRTAERINFVFQNMVSNGQPISGSLPYGLKIDNSTPVNKKVIIDDDKSQVVQDIFNYYESHHSQRATRTYIKDKYDIIFVDGTVRNMLTNTLYIGEYRDNKNFCPAIIKKSQFDNVQTLIKKHSLRFTPTGRFYIFSSLLICSECKHTLTANFLKNGKHEYSYYRCPEYVKKRSCSMRSMIREDILEDYLINNIQNELRAYIAEYEIKVKTQKTRNNTNEKAAINSKLKKLKDLYVNDFISLEEYKKDYNKYQKQIEELIEVEQVTIKKVDVNKLTDLVNSDFTEIYQSLNREKKRTFWNMLIESIEMDNDRKVVSITFR